MEGGAEQTTAAAATKIVQHPGNVAAQGGIPEQGNISLLKDLSNTKGGKKLTVLSLQEKNCSCPIPDLNSFSSCWGWGTPLP